LPSIVGASKSRELLGGFADVRLGDDGVAPIHAFGLVPDHAHGKTLGLTIPQFLLLRADQVIE
jgi:hypothetical protein